MILSGADHLSAELQNSPNSASLTCKECLDALAVEYGDSVSLNIDWRERQTIPTDIRFEDVASGTISPRNLEAQLRPQPRRPAPKSAPRYLFQDFRRGCPKTVQAKTRF